MKPIVVRGHHIEQYVKLFRSENRYDPETLARQVARNVAREFTSKEPRNRWYARDTMGTPVQEAEYRKATQAQYERMLSASSDQEIIVVTAELDDICRICTKGEHCLQRIRKPLDNDLLKKEPYKDILRKRGYEDVFKEQEDGLFSSFTDAYHHLFKWKHITRPPEITEVTIHFLDSYYPIRARRFHTDKRSFLWAAALMDGYLDKYLKLSTAEDKLK
jgi:hypothetical protein